MSIKTLIPNVNTCGICLKQLDNLIPKKRWPQEDGSTMTINHCDKCIDLPDDVAMVYAKRNAASTIMGMMLSGIRSVIGNVVEVEVTEVVNKIPDDIKLISGNIKKSTEVVDEIPDDVKLIPGNIKDSIGDGEPDECDTCSQREGCPIRSFKERGMI